VSTVAFVPWVRNFSKCLTRSVNWLLLRRNASCRQGTGSFTVCWIFGREFRTLAWLDPLPLADQAESESGLTLLEQFGQVERKRLGGGHSSSMTPVSGTVTSQKSQYHKPSSELCKQIGSDGNMPAAS